MNLTLLTSAISLVLGGENIGFSIDPNGLLISGTYDIEYKMQIHNPKNQDIRQGDIILSSDGIKVDTLADLNKSIMVDNDNVLNLKISRDGKLLDRKLNLYRNEDKIKTGLYIKEESLGIGTITYYNPTDHSFGALGHPAKEGNDNIVPVKSGNIYDSNVNGIKKSYKNKVGQKVATLEKDKVLGEISKNTSYGLAGVSYTIPSDNKTYQIATNDEIKTGKAILYTVLSGHKKEGFDIEITDVKKDEDIKGLSFKIIDERLLDLTGGIIAGMSGSPIVQDNKIIGAVTHAITKDPTKGYGIFISNMINGLAS